MVDEGESIVRSKAIEGGVLGAAVVGFVAAVTSLSTA